MMIRKIKMMKMVTQRKKISLRMNKFKLRIPMNLELKMNRLTLLKRTKKKKRRVKLMVMLKKAETIQMKLSKKHGSIFLSQFRSFKTLLTLKDYLMHNRTKERLKPSIYGLIH
jgi:hypothetical protein